MQGGRGETATSKHGLYEEYGMKLQCGLGAGGVAQRVKALAAKPDDPSLISKTHVVEGEKCSSGLHMPLWHTRPHMCTHTDIHTLIRTISQPVNVRAFIKAFLKTDCKCLIVPFLLYLLFVVCVWGGQVCISLARYTCRDQRQVVRVTSLCCMGSGEFKSGH